MRAPHAPAVYRSLLLSPVCLSAPLACAPDCSHTLASTAEILYPSINFREYEAAESTAAEVEELAASDVGRALASRTCFVSINRCSQQLS